MIIKNKTLNTRTRQNEKKEEKKLKQRLTLADSCNVKKKNEIAPQKSE
jgi:hypothetical protein